MKVFVALALIAFVGCAVEARSLHVRALKDTLISRGNALLKTADEAIKTLEASHRPNAAHEVTVVKTEEARIKKLIADLEAATDDTKVAALEHDLTRAETALQFELTKIHAIVVPVGPGPVIPASTKAPVVTRDLKDNLVNRADSLVKQAEEAITKLTAEKKDHEATVIKTEEAKIKSLAADLKAATEQVKIHQLELELGALEARLAHELNRINHTNPGGPIIREPTTKAPVVTRDLKSDLTTKAKALEKKAEDEIKKLEADSTKAHEVTVLKTEEAKIKKLAADLEKETDEAKLKTIEHNLTTAENKLATELAKIEHGSTGAKTTKAPATATTSA